MKVFISADIEGTTLTTYWNQTSTLSDAQAKPHCRQMTAEVKAACEGAIAAGATEILIKDGHGSGINIDINELPECAKLIRNWVGDPLSMASGCDETFDAAMFVGYHSAAGRKGNPLSHTESTQSTSVRLNGMVCSEFLLYSWACAMMGVPTVMLAGDKMLTEDSQGIHPKLKTVAVKDGLGGSIRCLHPKVACDKIRAAAEEALRQDLSDALAELPDHFVFEISYKEHKVAARMSAYPGCRLIDPLTVRFESDDFMEVLRCGQFIM
ncbi:MAG: M55 family metallopeptidase [Clostridia bacterium]|nr:M55 family metallopeptidase [Clostridia bacterium]